MIPVVTSTKTDKLAIDLAGVEAGAKIFVPFGDKPLGSLAHTAMANQNRRSIVCTKNRNVEDCIFNIDFPLLPFFTYEKQTIARLRTFFQFLLQALYNSYRIGIPACGEQTCYQRARRSYFPHRKPRCGERLTRCRSLTSRSDARKPAGQCHPYVACVKCHLCCHAIIGMRLAPI